MIKDLSIALEAISRINCEGSAELYQRISYALERSISQYDKEMQQEQKSEATADDEIPF